MFTSGRFDLAMEDQQRALQLNPTFNSAEQCLQECIIAKQEKLTHLNSNISSWSLDLQNCGHFYRCGWLGHMPLADQGVPMMQLIWQRFLSNIGKMLTFAKIPPGGWDTFIMGYSFVIFARIYNMLGSA